MQESARSEARVVDGLGNQLGSLDGTEFGVSDAVSAGEACFQLGQPERAREFFAEALRREPRHAEALNNMGVIAFQEGRFTEAEGWFLQSLTASEVGEARTNLSLMYRAVPEMTVPRPGAVVCCPCCGGHFPEFISGGPRRRPRACCPCCGSLERHRLTWLYLKEKTHFFSAPLRVLHVAPERVFRDAFRSLPNLEYVSADISSPLAMLRMDLAAIPCRGHIFDVILCSHVLEHVPEDRRAMGELARVLRPDGWALVQVPLDEGRETTFEDPTITEPSERQRLFGQHDHVRWYGRDFPQRLAESGFEVRIEPFFESLSPEDVGRYGLVSQDKLHICRKAPRRLFFGPGTARDTSAGTGTPRPEPHAELNEMLRRAAAVYGVVPEVHEADFILGHSLARNPNLALVARRYFDRGDYAARRFGEFMSGLHGARGDLRFLDFASGYGCVARHLARTLPRGSRVVCCDIHPAAVEFIRGRLGLEAVISSTVPEELRVEGGFEGILALSFFSHMPLKTWGRWLKVLLELLSDQGVMVFTAHGHETLRRANYPLEKFTGFKFSPESEQKDLDRMEYGNTIVAPRFVVDKIPPGFRLLSFAEADWEGYQDVYVVARNSAVWEPPRCARVVPDVSEERTP